MIDFENNYAVTKVSPIAVKLLFFNQQKCIGIGLHYENLNNYYSNGDILITNDGWKTFSQKTYLTTDAINFTAIAKISESKVMILSVGLSGTKVLILNR